MSTIIEDFYRDNKVPEILLKQKLTKFEQNPDIGVEFEFWIQNRQYKTEGIVSVEGYTAKKLSETSRYLDGEGAFIMLIELRENPKKALARIVKGFKRK